LGEEQSLNIAGPRESEHPGAYDRCLAILIEAAYDSELLWQTNRSFRARQIVREFQGFDQQAYKRLEILNATTRLEDLRTLRSELAPNVNARFRELSDETMGSEFRLRRGFLAVRAIGLRRQKARRTPPPKFVAGLT
jgi:plasmid maintenance system killer protein